MSELKKCPFSGCDTCVECEWYPVCEFSQTDMPVKLWNHRPIEDKLQAELESEKRQYQILADHDIEVCEEIKRLKDIADFFEEYHPVEHNNMLKCHPELKETEK